MRARQAVGAALSEQDVSRTAIVEALGLAASGGEVLFVGRNRFDIMVEVRSFVTSVGSMYCCIYLSHPALFAT